MFVDTYRFVRNLRDNAVVHLTTLPPDIATHLVKLLGIPSKDAQCRALIVLPMARPSGHNLQLAIHNLSLFMSAPEPEVRQIAERVLTHTLVKRPLLAYPTLLQILSEVQLQTQQEALPVAMDIVSKYLDTISNDSASWFTTLDAVEPPLSSPQKDIRDLARGICAEGIRAVMPLPKDGNMSHRLATVLVKLLCSAESTTKVTLLAATALSQLPSAIIELHYSTHQTSDVPLHLHPRTCSDPDIHDFVHRS
jgi:hypothetical protein